MQTFLLKKLHGRSVAQGQPVDVVLYGKQVAFIAESIDPDPAVVGDDTAIKLIVHSKADAKIPDISKIDESRQIINLNGKPLTSLQQLVEIYLDEATKPAFKFTKVLLLGSDKSGKTTILNMLANRIKESTKCEIISISMMKDSSVDLKKKTAPYILILDDLNAVDDVQVKQTIASVQRMAREGALVIGSSSTAIVDSLRSIFEKTVELQSMTLDSRLELLRSMVKQANLNEDQLLDIALRTSGFNFEDFARLAKNFNLEMFVMAKQGIEHFDNFKIVRKCLSETKPITLSFAANTPNVKWSDIGGYDHVKQLIHRVVELPMKNPELFKRRGIKPSKVNPFKLRVYYYTGHQDVQRLFLQRLLPQSHFIISSQLADQRSSANT